MNPKNKASKPTSNKGTLKLKNLPKLHIKKSFISMRSLKKSPEVRNLYKFILDYDLRKESAKILEDIIIHQKKRKQNKN